MSLRWRLILWQVGLLVVALMGFSFVSYGFLANGLATETDNTLRERAQHVLEAIQTVPNRRVEEVWAPTDEFASPGVYVQILTPEGQVVAHSDNLGRQRLPVNPVLLEQVLSGQTFYTTETVAEQRIRLFHQPIIRNEESVGVIQVGQSLQGLESTLRQLQTIYLVGLVVALILGGGVSWFLLRLGLRPVTQMAQIQELANDVHLVLEQCDPVSVLGDPDRLKQLLLNLIDNALQHTGSSGRVTLSLACQENLAHLTVADTGCGISAADLPHIFERFYRGHNGKRSTGLGLSIVKWIVEEHHGDITVESEPGQGTIFIIRLPIWNGKEPACGSDQM